MKKILIYVMLGLILLPNISVNAATDAFLENNNGIKMTQEEYQKLKAIDFTDKEIMNMQEDEFNILTDYDDGNVENNIKYIKQINVYNSNSTYSLRTAPVKTYTYEITEEEYEKASTSSSIIPNSLVNDGATYETTYKKIALVISYRTESPSTKNVSAKLTWKTMPSVRSFDIIAIRVENGWLNTNTQSGTVNYSYKSTPNCDGFYLTYDDSDSYSNNDVAWNKKTLGLGYSGIGLAVGLKTDGISCYDENTLLPYYDTMTEHSTYIVSTATAANNNQITAYATYQHATSYVTFGNVYNTYNFLSSGLGGVVSFTNGMGSNYDGMRGVSLTY